MGWWAGRMAQSGQSSTAAASMSLVRARESDATVEFFTVRAIWRTLSKSPGDAMAKPA